MINVFLAERTPGLRGDHPKATQFLLMINKVHYVVTSSVTTELFKVSPALFFLQFVKWFYFCPPLYKIVDSSVNQHSCPCDLMGQKCRHFYSDGAFFLNLKKSRSFGTKIDERFQQTTSAALFSVLHFYNYSWVIQNPKTGLNFSSHLPRMFGTVGEEKLFEIHMAFKMCQFFV